MLEMSRRNPRWDVDRVRENNPESLPAPKLFLEPPNRTMHIEELRTPALLVDLDAVEHNLRTMSDTLPGARLRPHVKAHKTTALARRQADRGHVGFTCATIREIQGMAAAGMGEDLLLANEVLDAHRLRDVEARVTVAVDSVEVIDAAAKAGVREVVVDVNVGVPRCGCVPEDAGRLADRARSKRLEVRGVMGYEGHAVGVADRDTRSRLCAEAMESLLSAHKEVGGDLISAGGTGTYDINTWATEIQAGSYLLMDTEYAKLDIPFHQGVCILATVISSSGAYAVGNCGLKALGMDHGNPEVEGGHKVWLVSDEHITFSPPLPVGERIKVRPAHLDPTVAYHERIYAISGEEVVDEWQVDLRGW